MKRAFTLVELLVVIAIIGILSGIAIPAVKNIMHGNDESQAVNLVRAEITGARMIAISQHRMAGVVFFEETPQYSSPVNAGQTAMQICVQDLLADAPSGFAVPVYVPLPNTLSAFSGRQYLPAGMRLATLTDSGPSVNVGARVIMFDANGELLFRSGMAAGLNASGDWGFGPNVSTSCGFLVYSGPAYDAQPVANRPVWIKQNADAVIVNGYTGGVIR